MREEIVKCPVYVRGEPYTVKMMEPAYYATVEFYSSSGSCDFVIQVDVHDHNDDYVRIIKEAREAFEEQIDMDNRHLETIKSRMTLLEAWDGH